MEPVKYGDVIGVADLRLMVVRIYDAKLDAGGNGGEVFVLSDVSPFWKQGVVTGFNPEYVGWKIYEEGLVTAARKA